MEQDLRSLSRYVRLINYLMSVLPPDVTFLGDDVHVIFVSDIHYG